MIKNYRFKIDFAAVFLFLLIMLPNIIWSFIPAINDVLKRRSETPNLDLAASVVQVIMVVSICLLQNKNIKIFSIKNTFIAVSGLCLIVYYICWGLYYCGNVVGLVLLSMCIFPCLSFIFFAVDRKNYIALVFSIIFAILHISFGFINFILN